MVRRRQQQQRACATNTSICTFRSGATTPRAATAPTSHQQRQQLVTQRLVGHALPILV